MTWDNQIKVTNSTLKRQNEKAISLFVQLQKLPDDIKFNLPSGFVADISMLAGTADSLEEDRKIQEATNE
jgi:hypothetical protein